MDFKPLELEELDFSTFRNFNRLLICKHSYAGVGLILQRLRSAVLEYSEYSTVPRKRKLRELQMNAKLKTRFTIY